MCVVIALWTGNIFASVYAHISILGGYQADIFGYMRRQSQKVKQSLLTIQPNYPELFKRYGTVMVF